MKRLSGTLLAILLAALLGMGVMAFTTAAPETSAPPASDTDRRRSCRSRCASRTGG